MRLFNRKTEVRTELRLATIDDLRLLVALDQASFDQPWQAATWQAALCDPKYIVLVAQQQNILCAFGVAYTVDDEGEIATLAVDEAMRGQGLGETIFGALMDECFRSGAKTIFLEVRESNQSARRLYTRLGFQTVGERPNYYNNGETAVVMSKIAPLVPH